MRPLLQWAQSRAGRFLSGKRLWVLDRGDPTRTIPVVDGEPDLSGETIVSGYTTEAAATPVTYPLLSNSDGRYAPSGGDASFAWYSPGRTVDLYAPDDPVAPLTPWDIDHPGLLEWGVDELPQAEPAYLTSPQLVPIRSGLFTPVGERVQFTVEIGAAVTGLAKATHALYIGPPDSVTVNYGLDQLAPDKEHNVGGVPAAGVEVYPLGATNPHSIAWPDDDFVLPTPADTLSKDLVIEDLVPGQEYKWEVASAIVGAAGGYNFGAAAGARGFAVNSIPGRAGFLRALVHCSGDETARVMLIGQNPGNEYEHEIFSTPVAPGTSCAVAINSPGNAGLITNFDADGFAALQVVDCWTGEMDAHAIKAGASGALGVWVHPDGTVAFVTAFNSDKLLRFSFSTFDWEATEYATGDSPLAVEVSPDGEYAAVACVGGGLSLVTLATDDVSDYALPGAYAGFASAIAWAPDSSEVWVLVAAGANAKLVPFDIATLAWDTDRGLTLTGLVAGLVGISFQPDGKNLFLFRTSTPQVSQYTVHPDRPPTLYLSWPSGGNLRAGACGANGQIFATAENRDGTDDWWMQWWGSRMRIRNEGVGEFFNIAIEGVEP